MLRNVEHLSVIKLILPLYSGFASYVRIFESKVYRRVYVFLRGKWHVSSNKMYRPKVNKKSIPNLEVENRERYKGPVSTTFTRILNF